MASIYYFEQESGLLSFSHNEDRDPQTGTYFKDYTEIKGILIPLTEEFYRSGRLEYHAVLQEVQINEPLDDPMFQVPH